MKNEVPKKNFSPELNSSIGLYEMLALTKSDAFNENSLLIEKLSQCADYEKSVDEFE